MPDVLFQKNYEHLLNRDLLNKGISSLFWKQSWYEKRIKGAGWSLNNLVVERPVARATKDLNLLALWYFPEW